MSLSLYKSKRSFDKTPEPDSGTSDTTSLKFVIQKHHASRLHYDFRLEMDGVLKSWAVPKGPSTDPAVKRLAMMVEDHPFDYKDFEGIIPKGNYGAGTVIVWDEGTYEPIETIEGKKKDKEKLLLKELDQGSLKFRLNGKKLKGEFLLVRTKGMDDNAWLLIKNKDAHSSKNDITIKDKSVISGKTLEEVRFEPEKIFHREIIKSSNKVQKNQRGSKDKIYEQSSIVKESDTAQNKAETDITSILKTATEQKFTTEIIPMLATLVDEPFSNDGWEYEVKWDGYRALAFINNEDAELRSRNKKSFNEQFYPIYQVIKNWNINAIIDGEIIVTDKNGKSDFGSLQNWRSEADGELLFYVFDILWMNGKNLMDIPLTKRKLILQSIVPKEGLIRIGYSVLSDGNAFFEAAKELGLEGIVAKRSDSTYHPGARSKDWLKIKIKKRQEVVIAGYTRNENSPKLFSSLLLGIYQDGQLMYAGKVGTGFKDKQQQEMLDIFKPLENSKSPFSETPDYNKSSRFRPNPPKTKATWLKPFLVCEVSFTEVTSDGVFRHPSFEGLREDKKAQDVIREIEEPVKQI